MPIFLVFGLIAACLPIDWPEPPFEPAREVAVALSSGAVALVLLVAVGLRTWVVRAVRRDPGRRIEVGRAYARWRRALFFVNVGTAAGCVLALGWGWYAQRAFLMEWNGKLVLAPFAELGVPLPYFVVLFACWVIYYDAERALHEARGYDARPFAPRLAYLLHNLRQFALMVMLPVGLIVTQQTLTRFLPETTRSDVYRIASLAVVPLLLLFMPLLMKPLLGLKSMPAGPIRDRLEALAKRLNFRCTDFLLWPTHGAAANALIAGLLPRVRYVVFTDRILDDLPDDELDAVFGHEVGHAKHGHIWLYAGFLSLSLAVLAALLILLSQQVPDDTWFLLVPVVVTVAYLFVVFGALSRRCERQADVFGCRAVSCADPTCTSHGDATEYPRGGAGLCPTGIRTFVRALERVGDLHGLTPDGPERRSLGALVRGGWAWVRHWMHGPMPRRIAYLRTLIECPARERRFQRRLFAFKCVLMLSLLAALIALGRFVGWEKLYEQL
jgi:Zn-dependent protease with chaperone function